MYRRTRRRRRTYGRRGRVTSRRRRRVYPQRRGYRMG